MSGEIKGFRVDGVAHKVDYDTLANQPFNKNKSQHGIIPLSGFECESDGGYFSTSLTLDNLSMANYSYAKYPWIKAGETYIVYFDAVPYECKCVRSTIEEKLVLGNISKVHISDNDDSYFDLINAPECQNDYPFFIGCAEEEEFIDLWLNNYSSNQVMVIYTSDTNEHFITIIKKDDVIEDKALPDRIKKFDTTLLFVPANQNLTFGSTSKYYEPNNIELPNEFDYKFAEIEVTYSAEQINSQILELISAHFPLIIEIDGVKYYCPGQDTTGGFLDPSCMAFCSPPYDVEYGGGGEWVESFKIELAFGNIESGQHIVNINKVGFMETSSMDLPYIYNSEAGNDYIYACQWSDNYASPPLESGFYKVTLCEILNAIISGGNDLSNIVCYPTLVDFIRDIQNRRNNP